MTIEEARINVGVFVKSFMLYQGRRVRLRGRIESVTNTHVMIRLSKDNCLIECLPDNIFMSLTPGDRHEIIRQALKRHPDWSDARIAQRLFDITADTTTAAAPGRIVQNLFGVTADTVAAQSKIMESLGQISRPTRRLCDNDVWMNVKLLLTNHGGKKKTVEAKPTTYMDFTPKQIVAAIKSHIVDRDTLFQAVLETYFDSSSHLAMYCLKTFRGFAKGSGSRR